MMMLFLLILRTCCVLVCKIALDCLDFINKKAKTHPCMFI
uniref:Uncharacterized protein n=1 Tax=Anguilla anguilla TaxID=7936 RepID=A0A0E9XU60_ANGAN